MKALKILTQSASKAHGQKIFGHMMKGGGAGDLNVESDLTTEELTGKPATRPTSNKALDESAKGHVLMQDVNTEYPYVHVEPDGDEDDLGHEPDGPEEPDAGDEHVPQEAPGRYPMLTSLPSTKKLPESPAAKPSVKRKPGRPRRNSME